MIPWECQALSNRAINPTELWSRVHEMILERHKGFFLRFCLLLLLSLITVPAARSQNPVDDPFDLSNRVKDEPAAANGAAAAKPQGVKKLGATALDDRIEFQVQVDPQQARRGETVKMTITGM